MAKVFSAPKEVGTPPDMVEFIMSDNFSDLEKAENAWVEKVCEWARKNSTGELRGEKLFIQHADGYAQYVIFSAKPVQLIHLPIGDAWDSPLAHRLLTKDIREMIRKQY